MKLKIDLWRLTWRYLIIFLVIFLLGFGACSTLFFQLDESGRLVATPFGAAQIAFIIVFIGLFAMTYLLTIFGFYYVVEDKYFIVKRMGKEIQFDYKSIEYIDVETSRKKKKVIFYARGAGSKFLLGDKEGILLETLINKCTKVMTKEEFFRAHPEERY